MKEVRYKRKLCTSKEDITKMAKVDQWLSKL